jgi:hypothetical protein
MSITPFDPSRMRVTGADATMFASRLEPDAAAEFAAGVREDIIAALHEDDRGIERMCGDVGTRVGYLLAFWITGPADAGEAIDRIVAQLGGGS